MEAGETIALSGEVSTGQQGWVQDGPYFAYLSGTTYGLTSSKGFGGTETDVLLGQLDIDATGNLARVSIEFKLPDDVPPGEYRVTACNNPCRTGFGDLIGSTLFVGTDPPTEDVGAEAVSDESASRVTTAEALAVAGTADGAENTAPASTSLALARLPARATGLDGTWVAISAAFGLVVLLLVSVVRTKSG